RRTTTYASDRRFPRASSGSFLGPAYADADIRWASPDLLGGVLEVGLELEQGPEVCEPDGCRAAPGERGPRRQADQLGAADAEAVAPRRLDDAVEGERNRRPAVVEQVQRDLGDAVARER